MYFASNLQFLRKRRKCSQETLATEMGVSRSSINNYENAYAEPGLDLLSRLAAFFRFSVDHLLHVDLSKVSELKLREFETDSEQYIKGSRLRVLATTVDTSNKENIELVPHKAKAGYTAGYNDPEFIRQLPTFQLPFLTHERKYRTFQISGDSMLPIPDKSYVIGEFVPDWNEVKDGQAYVVMTRDEGIVFKILYNQLRQRKKFLLRSLNAVYEPYEIAVADVLEIWKFVNYISNQIPEPTTESASEDLMDSVTRITEEAGRIAKMLAEKQKRKELMKKKKSKAIN
jgi:transcriptional regulator with XRE-family HTH domain